MKLILSKLYILKSNFLLTLNSKAKFLSRLITLIVFFNLFIVLQSKSQCHIEDWTAIKALYDNTGGGTAWGKSSFWDELKGDQPTPDCDLSNFVQIGLNNTGRINSIDFTFFSHFSLNIPQGSSIPQEIWNLTNLKYLSLHAPNSFPGPNNSTIPIEIGNLVNLIKLELEGFKGNIPSEIGNLKNLKELSLKGGLSGSIPPVLFSLNKLITLDLSNNSFNTNIPPELGNLSNLKNLRMRSSRFTGNIPPELGNLVNLENLDLNGNNLTGGIPTELSNLTELRAINLFSNNLSGCHPISLLSWCTQLKAPFKDDNIDANNDFDATWGNFCAFGSGNCDTDVNLIGGCTDTNAFNFDPDVDADNGTCLYENTDAEIFAIYPWLEGRVQPSRCTNESVTVYYAGNFNYVNILSPSSSNSSRLSDENGVIISYNGAASLERDGINIIVRTWTCGNNDIVSGCTDSNAINYNPVATVDNISCRYKNPTLPIFDTYPWVNELVDKDNCSGNIITVYDMGSTKFVTVRNNNDVTKLYSEDGTFQCSLRINSTNTCFRDNGLNFDNIVNTWVCGDDTSTSTSINGCTDANATNYNPNATINDGSCQYEINGCTDVNAINYNSDATVDDGSCQYENTDISGCTDANAINYNSNATVDNGSCQYDNTDSSVFETYPWLDDLIDRGECNDEKITIYDAGAFSFVFIKIGNEGKLYFEDGTFYCTERENFSCVEAYDLNSVANTWSCGVNTSFSGCTNTNAINYNPNATINDGSCQFENTSRSIFNTYTWLDDLVNKDNCNGEKITIYNDGGLNFVFIENGNEKRLYFEDGTYYYTQTTKYSFEEVYGLNNVVQTWSCNNITSISGCTNINAINYNYDATVDDGSCQYENIDSPVFETYPWLDDLVNQNNCTGEKITFYEAGAFNYVFIENGNGGKLYFEDGTPYCTERPSLNCVEFYGLNDVVDIWNCVNVYKQSNDIASNKIELTSFNIYPNPATNLLNIDLPSIGRYQIYLMDISGKMVKQIENSLEVAKMNLSGLPKGIYLLEVKNDISRTIQKLVIE